MQFYQTPLPQTNSLTANGTLVFSGVYDFVDANRNGISDSWEKFYFSAVTTNRTVLTDTDGDGMPDYAEFIAGTDPTNPSSKFVVLGATNSVNTIQFQWAAVPGRSYQVLASSNLLSWTPVTDWVLANRSPMSFTVTNAPGAHCYRILVRP